jgi:cobalt-zinc-cadmium efflux system membrane fusion protein
MKRKIAAGLAWFLLGGITLAGCNTHADPSAGAPPPAHVEHEQDLNVVRVDHPERFSLVTASQRAARAQLVVTGSISPDVSRTVPVVSIATGRVVEIHARLGDMVQKGQLLMRIQSSDVSSAFSDYRKAVTDEALARTQLDRAKDLYGHGAIALKDVQVAQDAEDKAEVDVETSSEHLPLLGGDADHPTGFVNIAAPLSGVITEQQVTNAGGVQGLGSSLFTISDMSYVWVLCDVHENDLPFVHAGESADIRLNAYPGRVFKGTVDNIGAILDPNMRTTKVRIEVANPGVMRIGMFVTTTFHGMTEERHAVIPAAAILHLHDRDWVFVPSGPKEFRRTEVSAGAMLADGMQEIDSGIGPGQQVVSDALALENTVEQ